MSEQKGNYTGFFTVIIVLLLVIIAEVYYVNKGNIISSKNIVSSTNTNKEDVSKKENTAKKEVKTSNIKIIAITDKKCWAKCNTAPIIAQLKQQVPELSKTEIKTLDYSDKKAQEILQKAGLKRLPAFIFSSNELEWNIKQFLVPTKDKQYSLNIWASYDPTRKETPKTLDVFTMWYCPFGEIALKALPQIQKTFKEDGIKLNIHYIANKVKDWTKADSFQSLHWVPEAEEDIRQICINKNYGLDKLISYAQERYKNADNYGRIKDKPELAMKAVKIDVSKINKCINSWEWAKLLEADIKIAQDLWIWASPTWMANNKYQFGGIKAKNIQSQFCEYNPNLKWCKTQIKTDSSKNTQTPSCGK